MNEKNRPKMQKSILTNKNYYCKINCCCNKAFAWAEAFFSENSINKPFFSMLKNIDSLFDLCYLE